MKKNIIYLSLLFLLSFYTCKSDTQKPVCIEKLTYQIGQSVSEFPEKDYQSISSKSKLSFIKNLGSLDQDTLYRKAVKYYWDESEKVKIIEYGIMNNGSSPSDYKVFCNTVFLKYFECVPGFKEYIETDKWQTAILDEGVISLKYMEDELLSKVVIKLND